MNLIGFKKSRRYVFVGPGLHGGEELGTWFFKSYRHINPAKLAILGPTKTNRVTNKPFLTFLRRSLLGVVITCQA